MSKGVVVRCTKLVKLEVGRPFLAWFGGGVVGHQRAEAGAVVVALTTSNDVARYAAA